MNNEYRLKQSDYIELKNPDFEKIKNLSESEKEVIKLALEKFGQGKDVSIPLQIAEKLMEPTTNDPTSLEETTGKIFSREISKTPVVLKEKPHTVNEANRMIWKALGNAKPVEGKEEIIIAGQVLGDGRGDWAAIRNMHKILSKKFPDRNIRVIASSAERWKDKLDISNMKHLDLIYYENESTRGAKVPLEAFKKESEKILKKAQDASVFIAAGVTINTVFESIKEELKEKSIKMNEHDFSSVSGTYHELGDTIIQAGLDVLDNRMGIFARSSYEEDHSWNELKSPQLLSGLLMTDKPSIEEIESYLSTNECFFGYTNGEEAKGIFMEQAVLFASNNSPNKMVDICIPGICQNNAQDVTSENIYLLAGLSGKVAKLHVVWFEGSERREKTIVIPGSDGILKEIRIVDPGNISKRDFKIMTNVSAPLVGCTGDNSLAQTISYGKIPCYETRFPEKFSALVNKVEEVLGKDSALYKYYTSGDVTVDGLADDAKQFGRFIREEANLKPILNGVVNEKILRQKDPEFAQKQDALNQKYLDNSISSEEFQTEFKALLLEKGLL